MMEHFRVLPTDPRLNDVTDEQIAILFQYWVTYDEEAIRSAWREHKAKPRFGLEELLDLGYSPEEAADIKRAFEES